MKASLFFSLLKEMLIAEKLTEKTRYEKEKGQKYDSGNLERIYNDYANRGDMFLFGHYSGLPKLGINPRSSYNTPLGVYSYPLMMFSIGDIKLGKVPFAGERAYLHLFTVKPAIKEKMVIIEKDADIAPSSPISKEDLRQKTEIYIKKIQNNPTLLAKWKDGIFTAKKRTSFNLIYNAIRLIADDTPSKWSNILMTEFGIHGILDLGSGTIHANEPEQAVIFRGSDLQQLATIDNKKQLTQKEKNFFSPEHFNTALGELIYNLSPREENPAWGELGKAQNLQIPQKDLNKLKSLKKIIPSHAGTIQDAINSFKNFGNRDQIIDLLENFAKYLSNQGGLETVVRIHIYKMLGILKRESGI